MVIGGAGGDRYAIRYTLSMLNRAPDQVLTELGNDRVVLAVVHSPKHTWVFRSSGLSDILSDWAGAEARALEKFDFETMLERWVDRRAHVDFGTKSVHLGRSSYVLFASGIQLPSGDPTKPGRRRYRCDHVEHHIVTLPDGSEDEACPEMDPDGTKCPGVLEDY